MTRTAMMELIKQNIERRGRHLYSIRGGESPRFLYTIGVFRKADAEIILAGCSTVPDPVAANLLNQVGDEMDSGVDPSTISHTLEGIGTFTLRKVHSTWTSKLMLGALDYYEIQSIAAWQLTLDPQNATIDQPDMTLAYDSDLHKVWRWLDGGWPYDLDPDTPVVTNMDALRGKPITEVLHWHDGNWEMFAGRSLDIETKDCMVISLATLLAYDATLADVLPMPCGLCAVRENYDNWEEEGFWEASPIQVVAS